MKELDRALEKFPIGCVVEWWTETRSGARHHSGVVVGYDWHGQAAGGYLSDPGERRPPRLGIEVRLPSGVGRSPCLDKVRRV